MIIVVMIEENRMWPRSRDAVIAHARAQFDSGARRSAWDSLLFRARREPKVLAYRDALSELYRRAGHLDQAGRWGAHDPLSLDYRELVALRRSLRQFSTEDEVRTYLGLAGDLPPEITLPLGAGSGHKLTWGERYAEQLESAVGIILLFLGGPFVVLGIVVALVLGFRGDPAVQSAVQILASAALFLICGVGLLQMVACLLRAQWVSGMLFFIVVGFAAAGLARADMTSPVPFG